MLTRIAISNYLLIDRLELELGRGLTIITGETGSGKSILIGALGLAMGDRAEAGMVRDPAKRCVIELEVQVKDAALEAWCRANELPVDDPLLLRRQIDPGGRSRAFVNDTPVKLEQLRDLGERLVHVHSQHQTLLLHDPGFQLGLIDRMAGIMDRVDAYSERHAHWRALVNELARMREEEARSRTEQDYLLFQLNELDAAELRHDEQEELEKQLARADNAGTLIAVLREVEEGLGGDQGVLSSLSALRARLSRIASTDKEADELARRIEGARIELSDIADGAARLAETVNVDPQEAARLRERMDRLMRLLHKHRASDAAALIATRESLRAACTRIGSLGDAIARSEQEERALREDLVQQAAALSSARTKAMGPLQATVTTLLRELGMPHATFHFEHASSELGPNGTDLVRALFSANKDRAPEPLDKAASGGELGRVMLALIGLAAESRALRTVIFDEIDTGVSGGTATRVGDLLKRMAGDRQVIAITHLPQIASKADTHLLVSKDHEAEVVTTDIRPLVAEERVHALAQMLSGRQTTRAAVENARELLKQR